MSEKYNAFGRVHTVIGENSSDLLLKCAGKIKIQWGNKFIDLIKDGKINADSGIFYSVNSVDSIGTKDGIYVTSEGDVYLKIGNLLINLVGEVGTTYVSFQKEQITESDAKYNALKNIGFLYSSLEDIDEKSLLNGIIYVEGEKKLYVVLNGKLSEFALSIPNPFTELFIIAKSDESTGSLVIKGLGINNSIAFDSFYIFTEEGEAVLQADNSVKIQLGDNNYIIVDRNKTRVENTLEVDSIQSIGATQSSGFTLYKDNNGSTLIVDNLVVRNGLNNDPVAYLDPVEYSYGRNIITNLKDTETEGEYAITLRYLNTYKVGDFLVFYIDTDSESGKKAHKVEAKVLRVESNIVYIETSFINIALFECRNKKIYLKNSDQKISTLSYASDSIDLTEYSTSEEVISRKGDLTSLGLKEHDDTTTEISIEGNGDYSKLGYFLKAGYVNGYNLLDEDNSTKFASTEWVSRKILPSDVNLYISDTAVDIEAYFSQPGILKLYNDLKMNTTVTYLGKYGIITISKYEIDSSFSAIVTAELEDGIKSHRSINATYNNLSNVWYKTSSFIIKELFNPGYYWSKETYNNAPVSPNYIGTTNTEIVSELIPYIFYTNDGKSWNLIDLYIEPDSSLVYFAASGQSVCSLPGALEVPMGFIGIIKNDGSTQVNIGKSNYAVKDFNSDNPETGDVRGMIPQSTRNLLINTLKDAKSGVIPSISGLPVLFSIKSSDIATIPENSMHIIKKSESNLSLSLLFGNAKVKIRERPQLLCRWTDASGNKFPDGGYPGSNDSIALINFWKVSTNVRILAGSILQLILLDDNTIYSDEVGFALAYTATHWENYSFYLMTGVCESGFSEPLDDDTKAKSGLVMNNSITIICGGTYIYGSFYITYRDYEWPEAPDSTYVYLSSRYAIDDVVRVEEKYRLPYPTEITMNLVYADANNKYKITGSPDTTIEVTNI